MTPLFLSHGVAHGGVQGGCGGHSESQDTVGKEMEGRAGETRETWSVLVIVGEQGGWEY